ncbi:hypothetical protein FIBSPDRAFT_983272 [Athelia psychrophila]|uniref:Uncharacterized protein n=1 Tax=Athelia psychrophila TaxID=1759441 RepID=A0A166C1P5_9AGAM|nr:hypothetical protein FIBSPDRAFT_983272 [Fibularhizoctonia sp. CBS 109695]
MPISTTAELSITKSNHGLGQQPDELGPRVRASIEPPIKEINIAVGKYLSIGAIPVSKSNPTEKDKLAVDLALRVCMIIWCSRKHFLNNSKLDACFSSAWPAIWKWLQFLDDQYCQSSKHGPIMDVKVRVLIALTVRSLSHSNALRYLVASTPGVITMITRRWIAECRNPITFARAEQPRPFNAVLIILLLDDGSRPSNCLPDLIAASGGEKAVAALAIGHLNTVLAEKPTDLSTISRQLTLVVNLSLSKVPTLLLALLRQGVIPSMVKMLVWLAEQSPSVPENETTACRCVVVCFHTLHDAVTGLYGTSWVVQALESGMISAILKSASRIAQLDEIRSTSCSRLLSNTLCQFLVHRAAVRSAAKALKMVERLHIEDALVAPIREAWIVFKVLAKERIAMKELFSGADLIITSCARASCTVFKAYDDLMRCNGTGGAMSQRDSALLMAIVSKDARKHSNLMVTLLKDASVRSSQSQFAFDMDCTEVPMKITLISIGELRGGGDHWDELVEAACQSHGKMIPARVEVQMGGHKGPDTYLFPISLQGGLQFVSFPV